jgi:hypothetical protein
LISYFFAKFHRYISPPSSPFSRIPTLWVSDVGHSHCKIRGYYCTPRGLYLRTLGRGFQSGIIPSHDLSIVSGTFRCCQHFLVPEAGLYFLR